MDRKWWTLIAVCVGTFMLLLDVTIVNVALPSIQSSLKANFSDLQWVVDAYSLMLAALLLTTGSLADLWGRRLIFVLGLVVFTGSSLASGLAESPLWLNLARGAQGVGASAMFSTGLALLGSSFQGRERGVAFGVWGAITGLAVAVGPVIGGGLTTGISWRWIFLVNVPIGVIAVIISLLRVEESKMPHARRPDPIGVLTFSGALAALVYALIKGDQKGWSNNVIRGCLIGAAALLILFLIAERLQRDRAMFDLSLFRKPTFTGGAIAAFGLSGGLFALFLYLTLYLQDVLGYSALQTGLRFIVLSGGMLLTSFLAGRLTSVVPIRFLIAPGLLMVTVGLFLMRGINVSTGWTHLIPGFIVAGAGTGLINPPLASTAIGVVRPERAGMASGINSTFRQVGIATGIAGLGAIFSHEVRTTIESLLSGSSQLNAAQAHALASSVANGSGARAGIQALPGAARATAAHALRAGFATGLNEIFLVGAILSLASAFLTLVLIRSKDFEVGAARTVSRPAEVPSTGGMDGDSARAGGQDDAAKAPAVVAAGSSGPGGEPTDGRTPETERPIDQPAAQPALVAAQSTNGGDGADNASELQVVTGHADIESNEERGQEATQVSEHPVAVGEAAHTSTDEEAPNDALHQRMSGYGYQSPLPPPPPPPSLVPPGPGVGADSETNSSSGPAGWRTRGYQKPSQAWLEASQAWRTRTEAQSSMAETPSDVQEAASGVDETQTNVEPSHAAFEQVASESERVPPDAEQTPSDVEQSSSALGQGPSDLEQIRSEIERTKSRFEEHAVEVEQPTHDPGDTSPEAAAARLRSAPAARSFWSRFSGSSSASGPASPNGSASPEASAPRVEDAAAPVEDAAPPVEDAAPPVEDAAAPVEDAAPPVEDAAPPVEDAAPHLQDTAPPADDTATAPTAPEAELQPDGSVAAVQSAPEPEPAPEPSASTWDAGASTWGAASQEPEPDPDPDPEPELDASGPETADQMTEPEPELEPELNPEPHTDTEPSVAGDAVAQPETQTAHVPASAPAEFPESEPEPHSDLASGQDVSMSTPPSGSPTPPAEPSWPSPPSAPAAPAMRDVRLVVEAVQSAEEAALAYAREIGEARRHLSEAIAHLDRADEARALLNRLAGGFTPPGSSSAASAGSSGQGSTQPHTSGAATPAPERSGGSITTPSPGIAIASPTGPITASRGAVGEDAGQASGDSPGSTDSGIARNPALSPPPRPGGWGPSSGGTH